MTGLEPGARVIGAGVGCGAFAEYTALPAAAVLPVPAGWAAKEALGQFARWRIRSVPRAQNAAADALVNQALDAAR